MDTTFVCTYYVAMNITLSVDERLAGSDDAERDVAELHQLSRGGGRRRWRFNRDELHERA